MGFYMTWAVAQISMYEAVSHTCIFVTMQVILKLEDKFADLSIEQFLQLYKAFLIWPNWVVEHYLNQYKIPQDVKICSPTWNEFFAVFVDRYVPLWNHRVLCSNHPSGLVVINTAFINVISLPS